jgi:hypothetical protein
MMSALAVLVLCAALAIVLHDFFEGETLVSDLWDEWRLSRETLAALDTAWAANPDRTDAVVSLTSIPSRLPLIAPTVKSLLRQTVAPAKIILNIPAYSTREQKPYVVPDFLLGLKGIEIHVCEDMGSATKLLPSLVRFPPQQPIFVVDDDRIYHKTVLACLISTAQTAPGTSVGLSGWQVPPDLTDRPTTIWTNLTMQAPAPIRARRLRRRVEVDILQGLSGYLVRPDQFDLARLLDYRGAPAAARLVDDVWIAGHSNASRFVVPARRTNYQPKLMRRLFRRTSLGLMNRGPGGHANRSNSIVIRHLAGRWLTERPPGDR